MGTRITKEKVVEYLKTRGKSIGKFLLEVFGESLSQAGEQAFSEAIDIGISNTVAALYDANVADKEILRVTKEYWGISTDEAQERLLFEKGQSTIRALEQHLVLQGYSDQDIHQFMLNHNAKIKIRHNKELWKLKNFPEKLLKEVSREKYFKKAGM